MDIQNARYGSQDGYPLLLLDVDLLPARLFWEAKPTPLRHGLVFLGSEFADWVPAITLGDTVLRGFTSDRTIFRLFLAFGLEVYYDRFQEGVIVEQPDPEELAELGDRLSGFALPGAPSWAELTAFS
jgi:hypothetical protein